jgi:hypothetical protein
LHGDVKKTTFHVVEYNNRNMYNCIHLFMT